MTIVVNWAAVIGETHSRSTPSNPYLRRTSAQAAEKSTYTYVLQSDASELASFVRAPPVFTATAWKAVGLAPRPHPPTACAQIRDRTAITRRSKHSPAKNTFTPVPAVAVIRSCTTEIWVDDSDAVPSDPREAKATCHKCKTSDFWISSCQSIPRYANKPKYR